VRERAEEGEERERGDGFVSRVSSLGIMGERGREGERERMNE
jgi:hypothetical protein